MDLEEIQREYTKGVMLRTSAKTLEEYERNTAYFYALEKNKYNAKTCYSLLTETGEKVDNQKKILKLQKNFYEKLYAEDKDVAFTLKNSSNKMVSEEIKAMQDEPFSYDEIAKAVKGLKNDKVPGMDGLPIDIYKCYWKKIAPWFIDMLNAVFEEKKMRDSMLLGIINLIPKPQKDTRFLKHLRPITLLNSDCKIVEKVLANRMIPALEEIINDDQTGFMRERRISTNIRRIFDILKTADEQEIEMMVLSLDFMKCFDKVSFSALTGALKYYGFGQHLIDWTKILYNDFKVCVQNNGHFSEHFKIQKGLHQGGPASSLFFLVCAEILADNIRSNPRIEGIPVKEIKNLLGQYADDADICCKFEQQTFTEIIKELEEFRKQAGFTVNYEKTVILRGGTMKVQNDV